MPSVALYMNAWDMPGLGASENCPVSQNLSVSSSILLQDIQGWSNCIFTYILYRLLLLISIEIS